MILTNTQLILIAAFIFVSVLIVFTMNKKEGFEPGVFAKLNNISPMMIPPGSVIAPNSYEPTYTEYVKYGKVSACPEGTTDVGGKCLTSKFGPKINNVCPATMVENPSIDPNMQCVARRTEKKMIGGRLKCYESQIETMDGQCMAGDDTVFTRREFLYGKWQCPPGTIDTGLHWSDGQNGMRQCKILP